jgi:hypothetical protein
MKKNVLIVKVFLFKVITIFFSKFGYVVTSKSSEKIKLNFNKNLKESLSLENQKIISLVFSKDRAMQLHAFLKSYFENIENYSKIIVLYKCSNKEHSKSYMTLRDIFSNYDVEFIEEVSFKKQLINIISKLEESKIFFYVDDLIFTHKFNYGLLNNINPYTTIVSLSRGLDMTYSAVLLKDIELPKFTSIYGGLKQFSWTYIKGSSDWAYPINIVGNMYATREVLSMIKSIDFKAPNSLESSMQIFKSEFITRYGVCMKNAVVIGISANVVQTEGSTPILCDFDVNNLLKKWGNGLEIERSAFYFKSMDISQKMGFSFVKRNDSK